MALAEGASSVGLIVAAIVGTIAYYLLSNKISLNIFFGVVTSVLATGFAIAFWTRNEMITALGNVLIAVVALVYVAVREPRTQRDGV